jgi:hypothetical protein
MPFFPNCPGCNDGGRPAATLGLWPPRSSFTMLAVLRRRLSDAEWDSAFAEAQRLDGVAP